MKDWFHEIASHELCDEDTEITATISGSRSNVTVTLEVRSHDITTNSRSLPEAMQLAMSSILDQLDNEAHEQWLDQESEYYHKEIEYRKAVIAQDNPSLTRRSA